jgi:hypothetical protein
MMILCAPPTNATVHTVMRMGTGKEHAVLPVSFWRERRFPDSYGFFHIHMQGSMNDSAEHSFHSSSYFAASG